MRGSLVRMSVFLLAAGLIWPAAGSAQAITAQVSGVVEDESQGVLPGATVTARHLDRGFERVATSSANGRYRFLSLPPGPYELRAEMQGFKTVLRERVVLTINQQVEIDFTLSVGLEETVTVEAGAPLVETAKGELGRTLETETIDTLPNLGRDYRNLVGLAPGVQGTETGSPRIGGNAYYSNTWKIDGVENDSESVANPQSRLTRDSVAEVQVLTNQFSAEFGRALGGAVNVVTRSGTNKLEGRAFYFHQDGTWNSKNFFALDQPKPEFTYRQYGGTLGGPITKDRTHFFLSGERVTDDRTAVLRDPAGGPSQIVPRPTRQWTTFAKLSHILNDRHTLQGSYLFDYLLADGEGVSGISQPSHGFERNTKNHLVILSDVSVLSDTLVNELRFQFQYRNQLSSPNTAEGPEINRPSSQTGRNSGLPFGWTENKIQILDYLTKVVGDHELKFGVNFQKLFNSDWLNESNFGGSFVFTTDAPFDANDASTYPVRYTVAEGDATSSLNNNVLALFVQDSWKVSRKLTLNLGLRYDRESGEMLSVFKSFPDNNNLSPRVSFAWTPWEDEHTVIRGGYGRFFYRIYGNLGVNLIVQGAPPPDGLGTTVQTVLENPGYPDPFGPNPNGTSVVPQGLKQGHISDGTEVTPFADQFSIGFSRQLGEDFAFSADYVSTRGKHYVRAADTNYPDPVTGIRPRPDYAKLAVYDTSGRMWYDALLVKFEKRLSHNYQFLVSYTLSNTEDDTWAQFITQGGGPQAWYNPEAERAKSSFFGAGINTADHEPHRVVVSGLWRLPLGFELSGLFTVASGHPYNITTGRDNNLDGTFMDRPNLANGEYVDPGVGYAVQGNLERNAGLGEGYRGLDLRVAWGVDVGQAKIKVIGEAFNVTNRVNYAFYIGNLLSPLFGQPVSTARPRTFQLGAQIDF